MRLVFADSGYWIATINSDDELSEKTAAVVTVNLAITSPHHE